jgi:hypothetical protein
LSLELLQVIKPTGGYVEKMEPEISHDELRKLYRLMVLVRNLDTRSLQLQRQGRIGFYIGCLGQEAAQIGSAYTLKSEDWVFPAYREIGTMLQRGIKLTYMPFIIKALIPALKQFPSLNATLDDEKEEIVLKKYYNIGIATDTEQGLVVPVVKNADHKSIKQLAEEISQLSEKARAGQLSLEEVQGGTFTITNVGGVGGVFAIPIINWPEVGILGVHKITKRPVVKENQIVIRDMTYLSVSFDHRVLDGVMAARFMNSIKQYLEDPKMLLIETD